MRVGIDVSGLFWKYKTGVQILYYGLVEGLSELLSEHSEIEFVFIDRSGQPGHSLPGADRQGFSFRSGAPWPSLIRSPNLHGPKPILHLVQSWNSMVNAGGRLIGRGEGRVSKTLSDIDVLQVWNWDIKKAPRARHTITIPDIIPLLYPKLYTKRFVEATRQSLKFGREDADQVVAISHYTKQDLVEKAGMPADKVSVVYPGLRSCFRPVTDERAITAVRKRYAIGFNPYLLSVGFLDPRKNVRNHLRAFGILSEESPFKDFRLVLVGPESRSTGRLLQGMGSLSFKDRICITGYIPVEDLVPLLGGAHAFLYCSFYEGFGLPIIESMACGIPVITSNSTALKEVSGDAAMSVDPHNAEAIAEAVRRLLYDSALRDRLMERGLRHASQFTWEKWAAGHMRAYLKCWESKG